MQAAALRSRSRQLRAEADEITLRLLGSLRRFEGPALGGRGDEFALRLARLRPAVGLVRHDLARWLERCGVSAEDARDLAIACSEACANAVEHPLATSRQAFEVLARRLPDAVEVVVRDFGSWRPASAGEPEARGRGLAMIRALTDEVDVVAGAGGTSVTMRRRLRAGYPVRSAESSRMTPAPPSRDPSSSGASSTA